MTDPQDLIALMNRKGALAYDGEGITQLEHAWQCGQLARQAGASEALQLASWLHDIGHLMTDLEGSPTMQGIDDLHQDIGAGVLRNLWGPAVSEPVRLHVQAKRYLVATRPAYMKTLSPDSVRSLALQGGPMRAEECLAFQSSPHGRDAQQLRGWDDAGKRIGWFAADAGQALAELQVLMQKLPLAAPH